MHERSLMKALLRRVENVAAEHPGSRVLSIRVRVGEFSGVDPELFASAYDDLITDSPIHGAALELDRVPLEALCEQCGSDFRIERFNFRCENCGSVNIAVRGGEEMLLDSVTMEETGW
jgi:hydrogenase nickel incorporation protein HypA/HybF